MPSKKTIRRTSPSPASNLSRDQLVQEWVNEVIADFSQEAKMAPADVARLSVDLADIATDFLRRGKAMSAKDLDLAKQASRLAITQVVVRNLGREDRAQISALNLVLAIMIGSLTKGVDLANLSR